jgi:outer membrane receptor protein involved in Fe transport
MNMRLKLTVCALLGGAGSLCSQLAAAVEATPSSENDTTSLETVIVTAQKRSEALIDVPMSVTALNGTDLDNLQAHDFADYAAQVPGLSLNAAQPGLTRLTLRGQNAGGVGSTVGVYVDESPFGSSTALLNGSIDTGDFDTWDMKQIEVLRGPQGTLYGANSEGGLLKFVTNAPELGTLSGAAELTGENVANGGNGGDVRVMLNLPLGDKMALRVSGFDEDDPGYINDPSRNERDLNDGHKEGGRASLLAAPTDNLSIRLTAIAQESNYSGINTVDVNPLTLQPLYGGLTQERVVSEPSNFKYENYNGTVDWNLGPVRILSSTSFGILDSETLNDATPLYGSYAAALFGPTPAPGALLDDNVNLRKFTQEIRLSSPTSDLLEWQAGAYFTHEYGQINEYLDGVTIPAGTYLGLIEQPIIDSDYKETAGFADVTYHILPQFDVQLGGRYSHNEQDATEVVNFNPLISPAPEVVTANSSGNVFTYSAAPQWHFDANTMVYGRVATGYRPGGPNVIPPIAPPSVEREYGADKTTNVELGVRTTQLDGTLFVDVAIYHVNWKDIQLSEEVDGFGINGNGGTARTQGLEWTVGYSPLHDLKLQWTGAYTEAKLTSPAPALYANSGDPLPYAPKWGTSLDGEYDWVLFGDFKAFAGATWSYVGARSSDFASAPPAVATGNPGQIVLPSYNTTAVRLGVDKGQYRFTVFGKNLTDARGITDYESAGAPYSTVTVIQPRTVGATLYVKF